MKINKVLFGFILLHFSSISLAQSINFRELSLNQGIEIAKNEKKQIFIFLESTNEDENKKFEDETFKTSVHLRFIKEYLFSQKSVNLRLPFNGNDAAIIRKKANIADGHLGLVWLDSKSEIHTSFDVSASINDYFNNKSAFLITLERYIEKEFKDKIDSLVVEHKKGNHSTSFLKECITACGTHFNQYQFCYIKPPKIDYDGGDLLEQYIQSLKPDQRTSPETIHLIASLSYYTPLKQESSAYKILKNSLKKAQNVADSNLIKRCLRYAAYTEIKRTKDTKKQQNILKDISEIFAGEGCNFVERQNFINNMVNHASLKADTAMWETLVDWTINQEINKLNKNTLLNPSALFNLSCEHSITASIKKPTKLNQYFNESLAEIKKELDSWSALNASPPPDLGEIVETTLPQDPSTPPNYFVEFLNNSAWRFYESKTATIKMLKNALKWSEVSLKIDRREYNLDTYAHLLSRLGQKENAMNIQREALEMCQKRTPDNCVEYEKGLKEISNIKE